MAFVLALAGPEPVRATEAQSRRDEHEILGLYPEFYAEGALILGFSELIARHPQTLVDILVALDDRIPVVGIVASLPQLEDVEALLKESKAPTANLDVVQVPVKSMWVRDYGPGFVRLREGRFIVTDAIYGREGHHTDDWIPRYLAGYFRLPVIDVPLRVFGGNLIVNGEGWIFTTSQIVEFNENDGYTQEEIGRVLGSYYGATNWFLIEPLSGEPTEHIDMFMTLAAPNVAVVASIDPSEDPVNARALDETAARLETVETRSGAMKVARVPMPSHADGKWRSYTNVIYAGGTLLVPIYPDTSPELDERVLAVYRELLPNWRVVPVDASALIENNGSLHCISINVPKLPQ